MMSATRSPYRGFTLIELLVVVAIIAVLAAILFPVFAKAREKARQMHCLANLRQIGAAMRMYFDDHDGYAPGYQSHKWGDLGYKFLPYTKGADVFRCPSAYQGELPDLGWHQGVPNRFMQCYTYTDPTTGQIKVFRTDYEMLSPAGPQHAYQHIETMALCPSASELAMDYPCGWFWNNLTSDLWRKYGSEWRDILARHSSGICAVFYDGHAKWYKRELAHRCSFWAEYNQTYQEGACIQNWGWARYINGKPEPLESMANGKPYRGWPEEPGPPGTEVDN